MIFKYMFFGFLIEILLLKGVKNLFMYVLDFRYSRLFIFFEV